MRSIEQVINVVRGWKTIRDTGEGVFVGDPTIIDELLDYLKEAKGLAIYQARLGSEISQQMSRHRKFTKTAAIAVASGDKVFPVEISERLDMIGPDATGPTGKLSLTVGYVK